MHLKPKEYFFFGEKVNKPLCNLRYLPGIKQFFWKKYQN